MAAARHNLTRRALLGASAGACVAAAARGRLPAPAAMLAAAAEAWERALLRYRRAEARLAAFQAELAGLPPAARAFPASDPLDDRFDHLECDRLAALRRLLRLPAPDLSAFALKVELTVDDQGWELSGAETNLAALNSDARRLCHGG